MTFENQEADQPAHMLSLISAFVNCCLNSILFKSYIIKIPRLLLPSVAEQAGLSPTRSHKTPKTVFITWLRKQFFIKWLMLLLS